MGPGYVFSPLLNHCGNHLLCIEHYAFCWVVRMELVDPDKFSFYLLIPA